MGSGKVLHARHDGVDVLRYEGDIRYPLAPSVETFVDRLLDDGGRGLLVDLTETESIDSTNLGLLARVATRVRDRMGQRVTIVSSRDDIDQVLRSMGFDEVFDIVGHGAPPATREIPAAPLNPDDMARVMLETHRALMSMNEQNRAQFRDVVAMLERETAPD